MLREKKKKNCKGNWKKEKEKERKKSNQEITWIFLEKVFPVNDKATCKLDLHLRCKSFCGSFVFSHPHLGPEVSANFKWTKIFTGAACFVIKVHSFFLLDELKHWTDGQTDRHLNLHWQWSEQSSGRLQHKSFWYNRVVQSLQMQFQMYYCKWIHSWCKYSCLASGQHQKHTVMWCTFVHGSAGEYEGAFNGGGTFPVASGVSAELPVPTQPKWVHLPRGGREGQCVLPCGCTTLWNFSAWWHHNKIQASPLSLTDCQLWLAVWIISKQICHICTAFEKHCQPVNRRKDNTIPSTWNLCNNISHQLKDLPRVDFVVCGVMSKLSVSPCTKCEHTSFLL